MVLVYIPAEEFEMGSMNGADDEKPTHTVFLEGYWIDQTEVTYAQYKQFISKTIYSAKPCSYGDDHPVAWVTWYDAQVYCEWVRRRLPTEAEWEKAVRGGLAGKKYPWGDETPVCTPGTQNGAQYDPCYGQTLPVRTFTANGYGLFDMAGNVWEWVMDWYKNDDYTNSPASNPQGPSSGNIHVLRGGGWGDVDDGLRVAYRFDFVPGDSGDPLGFWCAVDAGP